MYRILTISCAILCAVLFATFTPAYQFAPESVDPDVSGLWLFDVTTTIGTGEPLVLFEQRGEELWGHYSSLAWGEVDFTGRIYDDDLTFSFESTNREVPFTVTYTAVVTGPDRMEGILKIGSSHSGVFSARRPWNRNRHSSLVLPEL